MWFGSAESVASPFTITSVTDWQNDRLIYFKQAGGVASVVALAQVVGSGGLLSLEIMVKFAWKECHIFKLLQLMDSVVSM
ncbi:DEHA2D00506p [Debaryomyces hansenii CBS767]|uniref:DEHA2D00506p n=1 Tax=Debaryomyces hansenii (strain ATCC 36239 / CBS 767 / BCRC 21394 / JCM 1990 / NBRC 0083 / IGC 2968) TaxID=284592 RepID=B5RTP9_DEBHA|nr:DEHA2D00506p [Debaryomyces hansenii CBS767]CAR65605.1 DEHA2D00506p [Debaryomyces hansenii CBS767]|eukprot:XP_002770243.1 DEHA2D00506p [Debaryomyces hansenii CBS767]